MLYVIGKVTKVQEIWDGIKVEEMEGNVEMCQAFIKWKEEQRQLALNEGINQGISQGITMKQTKVIKNMIRKNYDVEMIQAIVEVSREQVLQVRDNL